MHQWAMVRMRENPTLEFLGLVLLLRLQGCRFPDMNVAFAVQQKVAQVWSWDPFNLDEHMQVGIKDLFAFRLETHCCCILCFTFPAGPCCRCGCSCVGYSTLISATCFVFLRTCLKGIDMVGF